MSAGARGSAPSRPGDAAPGVVVRAARADDFVPLWELMREFAVYERLEKEFTGSPDALARHVLGDAWPRVDCLVAEVDGERAGFAICFGVISTFWAKPILWLEDIFVAERFRGRGAGYALLKAVAALAVERGCPRVDWVVLDWNQPAIDFYERVGARRVGGWQNYRLDGAALRAMAAGEPPAAG
jgi:GNAT superfamily N-acetyltransferase